MPLAHSHPWPFKAAEPATRNSSGEGDRPGTQLVCRRLFWGRALGLWNSPLAGICVLAGTLAQLQKRIAHAVASRNHLVPSARQPALSDGACGPAGGAERAGERGRGASTDGRTGCRTLWPLRAALSDRLHRIEQRSLS